MYSWQEGEGEPQVKRIKAIRNTQEARSRNAVFRDHMYSIKRDDQMHFHRLFYTEPMDLIIVRCLRIASTRKRNLHKRLG